MANVIDKTVWDKVGLDKYNNYLDLAAQRHKLIAGNIANSTTPDYVARDIDFDKEINQVLGQGEVLPMKKTSPMHIANSGTEQSVKIIEHGPESAEDLNGVDIDRETANLAINQMRYTIGAHLLQKKLSGLKSAINDD